MTSPALMICVVASFWLVATLALWWQSRSWFPITILAPLLAVASSLIINQVSDGWGNAFITVIHIGLWLLLMAVVAWDMLADKKGGDEQ